MTLPPRTVLAAVDFSDSSRTALMFAARLSITARAALHVVHAEEPLLASAASARGVDLARETREELAIFVKSAPPAGDLTPVLHTIAGPGAGVITAVARDTGADVIVIGMRGISAAEHLVFGSTTESVLRTAHVPVVAVPDVWRPPDERSRDLSGMGPVVAAVENEAPALAAAAAAARLAGLLHTSLEAIHVLPRTRVLNRWQAHADTVNETRERDARQALEAALRSVSPQSAIVLRIASGNIAECIARAVAPTVDRHPWLVIGRRPGAAGSTAYRILTIATAPVLQYVEPASGPKGR